MLATGSSAAAQPMAAADAILGAITSLQAHLDTFWRPTGSDSGQKRTRVLAVAWTPCLIFVTHVKPSAGIKWPLGRGGSPHASSRLLRNDSVGQDAAGVDYALHRRRPRPRCQNVGDVRGARGVAARDGHEAAVAAAHGRRQDARRLAGAPVAAFTTLSAVAKTMLQCRPDVR